MNLFETIKYMLSKHVYIYFVDDEQIVCEAMGAGSFVRDWQRFGFKKTYRELKEIMTDYHQGGDPFSVYWKYFVSLMRHKKFVFLFGKTFGVSLWLRITHDLNKFKPGQFIPYARFFYGKSTHQVKRNFNNAWNDHLRTNKHHWQYWTVLEDDGLMTALDMPEKYLREMICDWLAANFAYGNQHIFKWYLLQKFVFSNSTALKVDKLMETAIKNIDKFIEITGRTDYDQFKTISKKEKGY